ncbi:hypothetical protein LSH36_1153g00057 [Paralvinella palmiformis]|uniref:Uncharacterized protein n=1 Tax=Paralvinella palmiformis TaxID=53620 RepID=A0AAD9IW50_9ANNE|nr:hypothetical protein LSH36_1153g00057 [Paralvinella palmiformis]
MAASIREKQTAALKRMLNFNAPPTKTSLAEPHWKVLIYDKWGEEIISPLLSVKDLRDFGITLHLLINAEREAISDVPAIYFVMPTDENIQQICKDFHNQLYEKYYLNFISAISRQKLEDLALSAIQNNAVTQISKVFDQYLNFISLEDDMFSLRHHNSESISYYSINKGDVKDTEMEAIMESIVDSLFSVFVTVGQVPIIRCPRGNAAEMVSEKLDKKLRDNIRDMRNSLFTSDTVQAEIEEGEVKQPTAGARPKKKKKSYDLNPTDRFWQSHKGSPFPTVAEAVQEELESYRAQEDEVKRLKVAMGLEGEDISAISMLSENTAKLTSAVSSLPELLQKKRLIDMHTNVATAILEQIKARKLDLYFETEEKLMSKSSLDKSIMDIINDPEAGLPEDKIRLFIINLICGPSMSETLIGYVRNSEHDLNFYRTYTKMTNPGAYTGGGTKTISMVSKLMSHASQFAMEGVKNLVVKKRNLPVTKVVDALMEMKSSQETDDYRYFDPKLLRASDSIPRNRTPFQEAFVFMVGGGNYIEYQNLVDYVKGKTIGPSAKKITYGCSQLLNSLQFLEQLAKLGREM